jgi:hypothetical protein
MNSASTPVDVTTTTFYSWINAPMVVALLFGFAGAVFIGIYILRRIRKTPGTENQPDAK